MDHQELVEAVVRAMEEVDSEVSRTLQDMELAFELQISELTHGYNPFDLAFNSVSAKVESTNNNKPGGDHLKLITSEFEEAHDQLEMVTFGQKQEELQLGDGNCLDDRNLEKMIQELRSMDETILQSASTSETNLSPAEARRLGQTRDDDLQANRPQPPWELEGEFVVDDPFYKLVSYSFGAPGLDTGIEKLVHNPFDLLTPDPISMADGKVCGESLLLGFEEYRKESAPQQDPNYRGKGKLVVDEAHDLNPFMPDLDMPVRRRMSAEVSTDDGTAATARAPRSPFMKWLKPEKQGRKLVQEDEDDMANPNWLRSTDTNSVMPVRSGLSAAAVSTDDGTAATARAPRSPFMKWLEPKKQGRKLVQENEDGIGKPYWFRSTDTNSNLSTSAARSSKVVNAGVSEQEVCQICFDETPASSPFFHVEGCAHRFCMTCNARHAETRVRDTGQMHVTCPHPGCPSPFSLDQLQTLLTTQSFEILCTRLTVAAIPERERVYCPYQDCSTLFVRPYSNYLTDSWVQDASASSSSHPRAQLLSQSPIAIGFTECESCHRAFCLECAVPWHAGFTCGEYQGNLKNSRLSGDKKLLQLAEEKHWKRCEKCQWLVELSSGCHHMTCRCGHSFCYNCGNQWPSNGQTCKCKFWDERRL